MKTESSVSSPSSLTLGQIPNCERAWEIDAIASSLVNLIYTMCKQSNFLFGLMRPKSAPSCHTKLAKVEGIEPSTRGFGDRRSTTELHRHWRCVAESNRVLSCLGVAIPPLTVRATHRIKKPSEIFIWEGSLIRYTFWYTLHRASTHANILAAAERGHKPVLILFMQRSHLQWSSFVCTSII